LIILKFELRFDLPTVAPETIDEPIPITAPFA